MPELPIDETVKYWRDQVGLLLKSGVAIVILFAGWALEHHGDFFLGAEASSDEFVAAVGLMLMSVLYVAFLLASVFSIYSKHLNKSAEPTLIPEGIATLMAGGLSFAILAIAASMSIR